MSEQFYFSSFTQHRSIEESDLHENKGVASAPADTVATSNGSGRTVWKKLGSASLDLTGEGPGYIHVDGDGNLEITAFDVTYDDEYTVLFSGLDYNILRDGKRYFFMPTSSATATNGPVGEENNNTWVTFDKVKDNEIYLQTVYSTVTGKHYKRYYGPNGAWGDWELFGNRKFFYRETSQRISTNVITLPSELTSEFKDGDILYMQLNAVATNTGTATVMRVTGVEDYPINIEADQTKSLPPGSLPTTGWAMFVFSDDGTNKYFNLMNSLASSSGGSSSDGEFIPLVGAYEASSYNQFEVNSGVSNFTFTNSTLNSQYIAVAGGDLQIDFNFDIEGPERAAKEMLLIVHNTSLTDAAELTFVSTANNVIMWANQALEQQAPNTRAVFRIYTYPTNQPALNYVLIERVAYSLQSTIAGPTHDIFVDSSYTGSIVIGTEEYPFKTITDAVNYISTNGLFSVTVHIRTGNGYPENVVLNNIRNVSFVVEGSVGQYRTEVNSWSMTGTTQRIGMTNFQIKGDYNSSSTVGAIYMDNIAIEGHTTISGPGYYQFSENCEIMGSMDILGAATVLLRNCSNEDLGVFDIKNASATLILNSVSGATVRRRLGSLIVQGDTNFVNGAEAPFSGQYGLYSDNSAGVVTLMQGHTLAATGLQPIYLGGTATYMLGTFVFEPTGSTLNGTRVDAGLHSLQIYDHATRTNWFKANDTLAAELEGIDSAFSSIVAGQGIQYWSGDTTYTPAIVVYGSDNAVYRAVLSSGPDTENPTIDPVTDVNGIYWAKLLDGIDIPDTSTINTSYLNVPISIDLDSSLGTNGNYYLTSESNENTPEGKTSPAFLSSRISEDHENNFQIYIDQTSGETFYRSSISSIVPSAATDEYEFAVEIAAVPYPATVEVSAYEDDLMTAVISQEDTYFSGGIENRGKILLIGNISFYNEGVTPITTAIMTLGGYNVVTITGGTNVNIAPTVVTGANSTIRVLDGFFDVDTQIISIRYSIEWNSYTGEDTTTEWIPIGGGGSRISEWTDTANYTLPAAVFGSDNHVYEAAKASGPDFGIGPVNPVDTEITLPIKQSENSVQDVIGRDGAVSDIGWLSISYFNNNIAIPRYLAGNAYAGVSIDRGDSWAYSATKTWRVSEAIDDTFYVLSSAVMQTTQDFINFEAITDTSIGSCYFNPIKYNDNIYLVTSNGLYVKENGNSWNQLNTQTDRQSQVWARRALNQGKYIVFFIGSNGLVRPIVHDLETYETSYLNFTLTGLISVPNSTYIQASAYSNDKYGVAIHYTAGQIVRWDTIANSPDIASWVPNFQLYPLPEGVTQNSAIYEYGGKFAYLSDPNGDGNVVLNSTVDFETWEQEPFRTITYEGTLLYYLSDDLLVLSGSQSGVVLTEAKGETHPVTDYWKRLLNVNDLPEVNNLGSITIYPNGSESAPATINLSDYITFPSPFPGFEVNCDAQIQVGGVWYSSAFVYDSGGVGVRAAKVPDSDEIGVIAGSKYIYASSAFGGDIPQIASGTNGTSAPFRVVVSRVGGMSEDSSPPIDTSNFIQKTGDVAGIANYASTTGRVPNTTEVFDVSSEFNPVFTLEEGQSVTVDFPNSSQDVYKFVSLSIVGPTTSSGTVEWGSNIIWDSGVTPPSTVNAGNVAVVNLTAVGGIVRGQVFYEGTYQ